MDMADDARVIPLAMLCIARMLLRFPFPIFFSCPFLFCFYVTGCGASTRRFAYWHAWLHHAKPIFEEIRFFVVLSPLPTALVSLAFLILTSIQISLPRINKSRGQTQIFPSQLVLCARVRACVLAWLCDTHAHVDMRIHAPPGANVQENAISRKALCLE